MGEQSAGGDSRGALFSRRQLLRTTGASLAASAAIAGSGVSTAQTTGGEQHWRLELGDDTEGVTGPATIVDGTVYCMGARVIDENAETAEENTEGYLLAVDAASGEEEWRSAAGAISYSAPTVVDGVVFFGDVIGTVYAVDANDGEQLWRSDLDDRVIRSPTVVGGTVFVGGYDHNVYAIDAGTGAELWRHEATGPVFSSPTVVDDTVYVGDAKDRDGTFHALNATNGEVRWTQYLDNGHSSVSDPATVADGTVFVPWSYQFQAVDAATGEELWRTGVDEFLTGAPTVADDLVIYGEGYNLTARDVESGEREWVYRDDERRTTPTVAGDNVIFGGRDFNGTSHNGIFCVGIETGEQQWEFQTEMPVMTAPTVADGRVVFTSGGGDLFSVDAGVDGSSRGSRVDLGSLGHHDGWRYADQAIGGGAMSNHRLVQTVESSRAYDGTFVQGDDGPAAKDLVHRGDLPVQWTADDPPLVAGRRAAPMFDLRFPDRASTQNELDVTVREYAMGTLRDERTVTLSPSVARGDLGDHAGYLRAMGIDVPEPAPLLEALAAHDENAYEGRYPTFEVGPDREYEIEVDGADLEEAVVERIEVSEEDVVEGDVLSVGFVGMEFDRTSVGEELGLADGTYEFDETPDIEGHAERIGQQLLDTFPVTAVDVKVQTGLVEGPTGNHPSAVAQAARRAEHHAAVWSGGTRSFRLELPDDPAPDESTAVRNDDVDVYDVNAALAVVPQGEFFAGWGSNDDNAGAHPSFPGRFPLAEAAVTEYGDVVTAAHELAHVLLGEFVPDAEISKGGDDPWHLTGDVRATNYALQDGDLEVLPGRQPVTSYGGHRRISSYEYRALTDYRTFPGFARNSFTPLVDLQLGAITALREGRDVVVSIPDAVGGYLDTDLDDLAAALGDIVDPLTTSITGTGYYGLIADSLEVSFWERVEQEGERLEALGAELRALDAEQLEDALEETGGDALRSVERGKAWAGDRGSALADGANRRLEQGVDTVYEVEGRIRDAELDLDYRAVPSVGAPEVEVPDIEAPGDVTVRDWDGEEVASGVVESGLEIVTDGGETVTEPEYVQGAVRVPRDAAELEVEVEVNGETHVDAIDPTVDPIRRQVEALPEDAFENPETREQVLADLETVRGHVRSGEDETAAELLDDVYRDLHDEIRDGYEPEAASEPRRDEVLERSGQQLQRFGGEVPNLESSDDSGIAGSWLVGGATAGGLAVGSVALYRYWGSDAAED